MYLRVFCKRVFNIVKEQKSALLEEKNRQINFFFSFCLFYHISTTRTFSLHLYVFTHSYWSALFLQFHLSNPLCFTRSSLFSFTLFSLFLSPLLYFLYFSFSPLSSKKREERKGWLIYMMMDDHIWRRPMRRIHRRPKPA